MMKRYQFSDEHPHYLGRNDVTDSHFHATVMKVDYLSTCCH